MIRVSLQSEHDWAWLCVPWMHFVNALIDSVLVLLPKEAVVLGVVIKFHKELTKDHLSYSVLKCIPSKEIVNWWVDTSMDEGIVSHFVEQNNKYQRNVFSMLLSYLLALSGPHVSVSLVDASYEKCVYRFINSSCIWVFWSGNYFVVLLDMRVKETSHTILGEWDTSNDFVVPLLSMDELMSCDLSNSI